MKKILIFSALLAGTLCATGYSTAPQVNEPAGSDYEFARRFAGGKLGNMLFSTTVDPIWVPTGDAFYYSYKTGNGTKWYIVEPSKNKKSELFDHDKLAAELTEIVKDPFIGTMLPIRNLEPQADGKTFTFEVVSTQEAKPDT
ncbi:MAG: S9 family peptidase, partial [Paramuribaculum sp.]|nr:S9 family peptidase [Paramuribaculum sp.]